jgi:hypothetical protein
MEVLLLEATDFGIFRFTSKDHHGNCANCGTVGDAVRVEIYYILICIVFDIMLCTP